MASFKVSQSHTLAPDVLKSRILELFQAYKERFGINSRWEGDNLILSGSGFDGVARCGSSTVEVDVNLGFAASIWKGQVEAGIKSELEKRLSV